MKVVFLDRFAIRAALRPLRFAHEWTEYPTTTPEQVIKRLAGADIAITNRVRFDADIIARLPALKLIAVSATGYECIDVAACRRAGITVTNVRDWSTPAVAEHAFAMMLTIRRQLLVYRQALADGAWQRSHFYGVLNETLPQDLFGCTLAIIGHGALGKRLARLAEAFDMQVIIAERKDAAPRPGRVSFDEALRRADVLCIACPINDDTRNLIDHAELARMKPGATLINTARGGIVNEQALADALRSGHLGGAGIDSLAVEPPRDGNPLLDLELPNLVMTPHMAFASDSTLARLAEQLLATVEAFVAGTPRNVVT
ncbi:MAG: D-2-hydroxyacid dehydrogenase [Proteobacteria bacterium]|nr:D-2-hydroxyacid dehydrogenase [Pseudomonadota bacterium]